MRCVPPTRPRFWTQVAVGGEAQDRWPLRGGPEARARVVGTACVISAVAAGGVGAGSAWAASSLGPAMGPATLDLAAPSTLETSVPVAGGPASRSVRIEVSPTVLPGGGAPMELDGGPERPALSVDPPGVIGAISTLYADSVCMAKGSYAPTSQVATVHVPAGASTTLHARFRVGLFSPWPGVDFRATFVVKGSSETATTPAPRVVSGERGAFVELRALKVPPRVGRRIVVKGRALARNPRGRVRLRLRMKGRQTRYATVNPDAFGRFRYIGWTARRRGLVTVDAQRQSTPRVSTACATRIQIHD